MQFKAFELFSVWNILQFDFIVTTSADNDPRQNTIHYMKCKHHCLFSRIINQSTMHEHVIKHTELSNHLRGKNFIFTAQLHVLIYFFFCLVNYKIQYERGQKYQLLSTTTPIWFTFYHVSDTLLQNICFAVQVKTYLIWNC